MRENAISGFDCSMMFRGRREERHGIITMSLNDTPAASRLHIGIFGKRNSGKSSLINAITGQPIAIVSDIAGTTADPVYKSMEIHGLGPCMLVDTAGFDDTGSLGALRVEKTRKALDKIDIAILVFADQNFTLEQEWLADLKKRSIPVLAVINKADLFGDAVKMRQEVKQQTGLDAIITSAKTREGITDVIAGLTRLLPEDFEPRTITGDLCREGDTVLLIMPQDIQAPRGRLILPQVQTIRELLDKKCIVISVTMDKMEEALARLREPPKLIITDSQVFQKVYDLKPEASALTSFSVLFAGYKGDLREFIRGASALSELTEHSRVLIAEACTHVPLSEDIGRVKLPRMLRRRFGDALEIDIVNGMNFPEDLSAYDLIIHCGSCMFNRKYTMNRVQLAREKQVPITNYGVAIAALTGILDKITY